MASQIDICNRALIRLGAPTIVSIDDNTKSGKLCKKLYDLIAKTVHGEGPWSTAVKRVALAKLASTPAFGYSSEFQLPSDLIKVIDINDATSGESDFRIEGDKLLIDASAVKLYYVSFLSTPGSFGIYLSDSITDLLASELAYNFTGGAQLAAGLKKEYQFNLKDNLAKDNQQGSKDIVVSSSLTEVR